MPPTCRPTAGRWGSTRRGSGRPKATRGRGRRAWRLRPKRAGAPRTFSDGSPGTRNAEQEISMRTDLDPIHDLPRRRSFIGLCVLAVLGLIVFLAGGPFRTVPAGHVGVKDFFGQVSSETLPPGIRLVFPLTRVVKMSVQTQEMKEVADVPSKEGLILSLETSLLFQLDPTKAADIYRTVGSDYTGTIVEPQFRSAIREITASYEAKSLYSAEREKIAGEIFALFRRLAGERGILVQQVLLRKIGLPPVVANAIQEKLRREQEAEQMKFVLQKEQQEAERKRI